MTPGQQRYEVCKWPKKLERSGVNDWALYLSRCLHATVMQEGAAETAMQIENPKQRIANLMKVATELND